LPEGWKIIREEELNIIRATRKIATENPTDTPQLRSESLGEQTPEAAAHRTDRDEQYEPSIKEPAHIDLPESVSQRYLIRKVNPTYPPLAVQARVQGVVTLRAQISDEGNVEPSVG
jgi:outer membrane biosynthesis protein TonB